MEKKKIKLETGETVVTTVHGSSLTDRIRVKISNLVTKVFYCTPEEEKIKVTVRRTSDGYEYDIDYGRLGFPFEDITKIISSFQESGREALERDPSKNNVEIVSEQYYFDPFGFKRFRRYLTS